MNITGIVSIVVGAVFLFMAGALMTDGVMRQEMKVVAADKYALHVILDDCGYAPHPVSDVSWELYRQQLIPLGTAGYYTSMVKSVNEPAAKCLLARLPEQWTSGS